LTQQIKGDLASGRLKQPVDLDAISKSVWKALQANIETGGAILLFRIKKEEIADLLRQVFTDLKVEIK
jgi:hypothetical protein